MTKIAIVIVLALACLLPIGCASVPAHAEVRAVQIRLWPGDAPGSEGLKITKKIVDGGNARQHDRFESGIQVPTMLVSKPVAMAKNRPVPAVLVMPGGGYGYLSMDREGYEAADWLNSQGYGAAILRYRLPAEGHSNAYMVPLADAQRAMRVLRKDAAHFGFDPERIGVLGFSAGGHLAALLSVHPDAVTHVPVDTIDFYNARPAFQMLAYPVISMDLAITHQGSRYNLLGAHPDQRTVDWFSADKQVDRYTPPAFIIRSVDDFVPEENVSRYVDALRLAGRPVEIHEFPSGGHGYGVIRGSGSIASWPSLALAWLDATVTSGVRVSNTSNRTK